MGRKRILVVDDEPGVCEMVQTMLEVDFHSVDTALSGMEALDKCQAVPFDVVVADYHMPGMKGDQLAIALKKHVSQPYIILISGDPPRNPVREIDFVLMKPFSLVDLRMALQTFEQRRAA